MNVIRLEEELLILTGISAIAETYPILIKVFEKFGLVNLANIEKKAYNIYKNDSERYGNNNLYKEKTYYYDLEKKNANNPNIDTTSNDNSKNRTCFYIDDHFKLVRSWFQETPRSWFDDVQLDINITRTEAPSPPPTSYPLPPLNLSYYKRTPKEGNPFSNSKHNPHRLKSKQLSVITQGGISKIHTTGCNVGTEGEGDETDLLFRKFAEEYMRNPHLRNIVSSLSEEVEKFKRVFFQNDGILEYNNIDWLSSPLSKVLEFIKKDIEDLAELENLNKNKNLSLRKSVSFGHFKKDRNYFPSKIHKKRQSGGCLKNKTRKYSRGKRILAEKKNGRGGGGFDKSLKN